MKKNLFLAGFGLFFFAAVHAQPGNFTRRTVEERVAAVHSKLDSAFKLEASKASQVDSIFAEYYRATDKAREELMSSGERPSREAMQEKMHPLSEARDEKLKKVLAESQYEIWKKQLEPAMRPQRPGGGN